MSCALLENAKSQYKILRNKPPLSAASNTIITLSNMAENNSMRISLKRPAINKPTSPVIETQKRFFSDSMILKSSVQQPAQQHQHHTITPILPPVRTVHTNLLQSQNTASFVLRHHTQPQQQSLQQPTTSVVTVQQLQAHQQQPHRRRQIFWNTAYISTTTKFVLDVQANQAFGFGNEGKERLASKHPELIRYLPDTEDRDWLINQQIILQQNRNSRFLFLIYDEVYRLYKTHEVYKSKTSIDLSIMMTFTVPEFMIQKMKIFFVDLNIKSRGLITNSYSIAGTTTIATQQPLLQSNSHLRNALLLGTQQILSASTTTKSTVLTINDSTTSSVVASSSSASPSSIITSTETLLQQKSKSRNLSSSHATLTALLNNSSSSVNSSMNSTASNEKPNNSSINSSISSSTPTLLNKLRK